MRTRLTLLIVALLALAAFATLNWTELVRPTQLSWGFGLGEAPMGLLLVGVLLLSWVGFLVGSAYQATHYQLLAHRNAKALEAQRVLADKAEASRFVELRAYLEAQATLAVQRENAIASRLDHTLQQNQRELRAALDRLGVRVAAPYPAEPLRTTAPH